MPFKYSFLRCCFTANINEKSALELPESPRADEIRVRLTSSIYRNDGTINWDDPATKNLLYLKGKQDKAIENYEFLFDCHRMRAIVQDTILYSADEKDAIVRSLAKEFFQKHITDINADLLVYFVEINSELNRVRCSINISSSLRAELKKINENLESSSHMDIMNVYESAANEIIEPLGLPPRQSRGGLFQFFTQSASNRRSNSSGGNSRDRINSSYTWARTDFSDTSSSLRK